MVLKIWCNTCRQVHEIVRSELFHVREGKLIYIIVSVRVGPFGIRIIILISVVSQKETRVLGSIFLKSGKTI